MPAGILGFFAPSLIPWPPLRAAEEDLEYVLDEVDVGGPEEVPPTSSFLLRYLSPPLNGGIQTPIPETV